MTDEIQSKVITSSNYMSNLNDLQIHLWMKQPLSYTDNIELRWLDRRNYENENVMKTTSSYKVN